MTASIPVMRPLLPQISDVIEVLARMDKQRVYSNSGPLVRQLESTVAKMCGVASHLVVATANATVALEGACQLASVNRFSVPAFTFPASALAVLRSGKDLVFSDVSVEDWQIVVTPRPEVGVVRVMPFGAPPDLGRDLGTGYLVVDAAASLGAQPIDLSEIRPGQCVVFSLHATKVLGSGEGGIIVFGDPDEASRFRAWINFGFWGSRDSQMPATNGKMSEIAAAYALTVLAHAEREFDSWREVNSRAAAISADLGITSLVSKYQGVSPYWIVELQDEMAAAALEQHMTSSGVETRRWWGRGCHQMPAFQSLIGRKAFPGTDLVSGRILGLPMFRDMTSSDFERISRGLESFLERRSTQEVTR